MKALVTGAAGFIGAHVSHALLDRGWQVLGLDNLNDYYDTGLKQKRLGFLETRKRFTARICDIADHEALSAVFSSGSFDVVIHLAAQAGVRYSLLNPMAYAHSNLTGQVSLLECVRRAQTRPYLIYASSSSVYGNTTPAPFREDAAVDTPVSLYAASKRSGELICESYTQLYGLAQTGLRFFTVYGPWGRPDMAYWSFTDKMLAGETIDIFNKGDLKRDFTWIGDIVEGVVRIAETGPAAAAPPHRIYNIGNNRPENLMDFIAVLEKSLGCEAKKRFLPMQPGDVYETSADITAIARDYGFEPSTGIEEGLDRFCSWFKRYRAGECASWS